MGATLIPAAILFARFNRQPVEYKWLAVLLMFSFLCDFVNEIQFRFFKFPVNIIGNLYVVLSPVLLGFFFYHTLKWKSIKIPLIVFCFAYVIFSITNFALIQKININTYSAIVEKLLIMSLSIMYFYKVLQELPAKKIYYIGLFWVISSLFIINSAKLVVYSFAEYLVVFKDNLIFLWGLHNILSIFGSLAITVGVLIHTRNREITNQISQS
jgi:hypothetical protein